MLKHVPFPIWGGPATYLGVQGFSLQMAKSASPAKYVSDMNAKANFYLF